VLGGALKMSMEKTGSTSRSLLIAAFAAVYIVWGSTYLAIRVVVETLPPFLSAGIRFSLAGGLLFALLLQRGFAQPTRAQWRHSMVTGLLLLLGGNGLVMWAERSIPSGLTALIVALAPVWFGLLDWLRPGGVRPPAKTIVGIIIGFVGVLLLVNGRGDGRPSETNWWAVAALVIAGICWAAGSLYSKHSPNSGSPWMNAATQMMCGGAGLLLAGIIFNEPFRTNWSHVSARSLGALAYLIVFGSWVAFSAYVWLLKTSTPSRVSTYAYVNPVIAVFLGWLLLGEKITAHMVTGAVVVLAGVIIITLPASAVATVVGKLRRSLAG
jgi:drug/metabolite transporter (DMT)-like permease